MGRVYEQMPHPKIAYAYLAIEAETWNEFEKLRAEALKRHPLYGTSAFERAVDSPQKVQRDADVAERQAPAAEAVDGGGPDASTAAEVVPPKKEAVAAVSAPTSEGLSPRDKAKAALAAKKGA